MNFVQFSLFLFYVSSLYIWGVWIFNVIGRDALYRSSRALAFGEALLVGSIVSVGLLLFLSLVSLYDTFWIWGSVCAAYALLLIPSVRSSIGSDVKSLKRFSLADIIFLICIGFFFLRNFYFLVDVDSHSTYLYAQKLWLHYHSSIFADIGIDQRIFVPHFESVPYALGISLFHDETLFAQLINALWRIIVLFLVYGYAAQHFKNKFAALAGVLLIMFNEHFFISGANQWSTVNGALIAFIFAMTYSVWEVRKNNDPSRLLLGLIFLAHTMACKYQMAFILFYFAIIFLILPTKPWALYKQLLQNKKHLCVLFLGILFVGLWYIKNFLATGLPTFPLLAWKFGTLDWTKEMGESFLKVKRGVTLSEFFKYFNYLCIWPGVNPLKMVCIFISLMPFMVFISTLRNRLNHERLLELCFWLGSSILVLMGICLTCHQDPRYYRYGIAVFAFASVLAVEFVILDVAGIKQRIVFVVLIVLISLSGYRGVRDSYLETFRFETLSGNLKVLMNKTHFKDVYARYYPMNIEINRFLDGKNIEAKKLAWDFEDQPVSSFLLPFPVRPQLGLFAVTTTIIKWDSYAKEEWIVRDLKNYGIEQVMQVWDVKVGILSIEEVAKQKVKINRYPKMVNYNYGFPEEIALTGF